MSWEEAGRAALVAAREDALTQAGVDFVAITTRRLGESSGSQAFDCVHQFTQSLTRGRILDERTVKDETVLVAGDAPRRQIVLEAKVSSEIEERDPSYAIDIRLDRSTFASGDPIALTLRASKDSYVTVFNLYSNDSLRLVFPNAFDTNNFLSTGTNLRLPPENAGWDLTVELPTNTNQGEEALMVVATRSDIPFRAPIETARRGLISMSDALFAINRWLVDIKPNERTTNLVTYKINR